MTTTDDGGVTLNERGIKVKVIDVGDVSDEGIAILDALGHLDVSVRKYDLLHKKTL